MSDVANIRSYHVVVDAPAEVVFDFVEDLGNMPSWSIRWCKGIRLVDGGAMVTTPSGQEVYFGITGDRDLGILDWWSGSTMETARRWPTRVTGLPDGRSLYQVTAIFGGAVPANVDEWFADELNALKRCVEEELVLSSRA